MGFGWFSRKDADKQAECAVDRARDEARERAKHPEKYQKLASSANPGASAAVEHPAKPVVQLSAYWARYDKEGDGGVLEVVEAPLAEGDGEIGSLSWDESRESPVYVGGSGRVPYVTPCFHDYAKARRGRVVLDGLIEDGARVMRGREGWFSVPEKVWVGRWNGFSSWAETLHGWKGEILTDTYWRVCVLHRVSLYLTYEPRLVDDGYENQIGWGVRIDSVLGAKVWMLNIPPFQRIENAVEYAEGVLRSMSAPLK